MIDKINSWHYVITVDTKNDEEDRVIYEFIRELNELSKAGVSITVEATPIMEEVELDEDI